MAEIDTDATSSALPLPISMQKCLLALSPTPPASFKGLQKKRGMAWKKSSAKLGGSRVALCAYWLGALAVGRWTNGSVPASGIPLQACDGFGPSPIMLCFGTFQLNGLFQISKMVEVTGA